jgi:uncharacterized protein YcfJ
MAMRDEQESGRALAPTAGKFGRISMPSSGMTSGLGVGGQGVLCVALVVGAIGCGQLVQDDRGLVQGENETTVTRTAQLPGTPIPIDPPGCTPPPVPVVSPLVEGGQPIPGFISWRGSSGATGYDVSYSRNGSSATTRLQIIPGTPVPYNGIYFASYFYLPVGSYVFFVQSFNSMCSVNLSPLSRPFAVTISAPAVPQIMDPGNNPYGDYLGELLDYESHGGD